MSEIEGNKSNLVLLNTTQDAPANPLQHFAVADFKMAKTMLQAFIDQNELQIKIANSATSTTGSDSNNSNALEKTATISPTSSKSEKSDVLAPLDIALYNMKVIAYYESNMEVADGLVEFFQKLVVDFTKNAPEQALDLNQRSDLTHDILSNIYDKSSAVVLYNEAVISYYSNNFGRANVILSFLNSKLENLEDWIIMRICFLYVDVKLKLADVKVASAMLLRMKALLPFLSQRVLSEEDRHQRDLSKNMPGESALAGGAVGGGSASYPNHSLSYSASCSCSSSLAYPSVVPQKSNNYLTKISSFYLTMSQKDAKLLYKLYELRIVANMKDPDLSKRDMKSTISAAENIQASSNLAVQMIRSKLEKNFSKRARLLTGVEYSESSTTPEPKMLNNIGIINFKLKNYASASWYFEQSKCKYENILFSSGTNDKLQLSMYGLLYDYHTVNYNLALTYMQINLFERALELFFDLESYASSPRLLIRIAECSLRRYYQQVKSESKGIGSSGAGDYTFSFLGSGLSRKLLIEIDDRESPSALAYVSQAIRAAETSVKLIEMMTDGVVSSKESLKDANSSIFDDSFESECTLDKKDESDRVRIASYLIQSYGYLVFEKYVEAACMSEKVLEDTKASRKDRMAARSYACQAYCMLNRTEDAILCLTLDISMDSGIWPWDISFMINSAVALLLQQDIMGATKMVQKAEEFISKKRVTPPRELVILRAVLLIRTRQPTAAAELLRRKTLSQL